MKGVLSYGYFASGMPVSFFKLLKQLQVQRNFLQKYLQPTLIPYKAENDGSLTDKDFKKIEQYYALAVPAVLGEAFAQLSGFKLNTQQRMAATFLAATTGLYDDYFDNGNLTDDYIEKLYRFPEKYTGNNDNEKLANYCWRKALALCETPDSVIQYAHAVHLAQIASRRQLDPNISQAEIKQITFDKGGYSVLLYTAVYGVALSVKEQELFYKAGALLQLENDLFDIYKDKLSQIHTLATTATAIAPLRALYLMLWNELKEAINDTHFTKKGKLAFTKILAAIVSRGFVCLDMLQKLQHEQGGVFNIELFTRKQLICDMEKPVNLLRTVHYYALILRE